LRSAATCKAHLRLNVAGDYRMCFKKGDRQKRNLLYLCYLTGIYI